jgi:hypothetical protein
MRAGGKLSEKGTPEEIFRNPGFLSEFNLKPPILVEVFSKITTNPPLTVKKAQELLARVKRGFIENLKR